MTIDLARSMLFVPGDRPDRFHKAADSGADAVICDLEDAVAADRKHAARANVAGWLSTTGRAWVRVNPIDTAGFEEDCAAIVGASGLLGVVVAKAADPGGLASALAVHLPGVPIIALVESAVGVQDAAGLARVPDVARLAFGAIDFALDIGADAGADADAADLSTLYARSALVIASRAAGVAAPLDGVTTALDDDAPTDAAARAARRLGFGGKLCVHPRQVAAVNAAFTPSEQEIRWARDIAGAADGASRVGGQMVDAPVRERARRILERAALATADGATR